VDLYLVARVPENVGSRADEVSTICHHDGVVRHDILQFVQDLHRVKVLVRYLTTLLSGNINPLVSIQDTHLQLQTQ